MRFIDRAFALAVAVFLIGASTGAISIILSSTIREFAMILLRGRMLSPIRIVSQYGDAAVFLVIFINNTVPVVLSFAYPFAIAKIAWTPSLTKQRTSLLLSAYTFAVAFFVGFFSFGAPLATEWILGGTSMLFSLIWTARVHGPLEFAFVLVCVAEPLRIARLKEELAPAALYHDLGLMIVSIVGLLGSSAIEVFLLM